MPELPLVAIVGEPNVGKSTLLNKIAGKLFAVTSPVSGTTRDRQYLDTSWNGVGFTLVDTAGITFNNTGELEAALNEQIDIAVADADLLLFVVDGKGEAQSIDRKAVLKFRKTDKPVAVAVNKLDSARTSEERAASFSSLGIKNIFPISSVTGRGIGDLLDFITEQLTAKQNAGKKIKPAKTKTAKSKKSAVEAEDETLIIEPEPRIAVSIVGKPNVGKSSIFNSFLKQKRVVVSSIPGTTRTAIDSHIAIDGTDYTFIDTAGLKKKEHRQKLPDIYSGFQTFKAIRRSDIAMLVIDATEKITKQDQHIASEIFHLHKGVIILANKIDLYKGSEQELRDYISLHFPFLWFSPMFLVSGLTGQGLDEVLAAIKPIYESRTKQVPEEAIKKLLFHTLRLNAPKLLRDQRVPKVLGLSQTGTNPPIFELYVNYPAAISDQYRKFVQKSIIKYLEFWGTPVELKLRGKDRS